MGIGYTRRDLEDVKTTGLPPVDPQTRPRSAKRQQLLDNLWQAFMDAQQWQQAQTGTRYGSPGRGRYAGFETRGEMDDYVRGRGIMLDDEAAAWYDRISELTARERDQIGSTYDARLGDAQAQRDALMPSFNDDPAAAAGHRSELTPMVGGWAPVAGSPSFSQADLEAEMGRDVPRNYSLTTQAAIPAQYGYDYMGLMGADYPSSIEEATANFDWEQVPYAYREWEGGPQVAGSMLAPVGERRRPMTTPNVPGERAVRDYIGERLWQQNIVDTGEEDRFNDYAAELDQWRTGEEDRIGAFDDYASMLNDLDLHEWAQMAATNELGIDPSFAAGAWGPEMTLAYERAGMDLEGLPLEKFQQDRDLWSLETFGVPYDEYVSAEKERAAEEERQQAAWTDEQKAAAEAADKEARLIFASTPGVNDVAISVDPYDLAEATDIPVEMLGEIIQSQEFSDSIAALTALYNGTSENDPIAYANQLAVADPVLYEVLREIYPDLFPRADLTAG